MGKGLAMPVLYVFRHAKSSWADAGMRDFDRPLANRGLKAMPVMGDYMRRTDIAPDFILCSTSRRTRETLGLALPYLRGECRILLEDGVYEAQDDETVLDRLRGLPDGVERAMILGHNPVMQDIALTLVGEAGDPERISAMRTKFPTAGLAVIDLGDTPWAAITAGAGRLLDFAVPRGLSPERDE
jgi:phosphohistidine phosphatase